MSTVVRPLLIVNPRAAGRRTGSDWAQTAAAVDRVIGPFDSEFTERRGHAEELARAATAAGRELVVAVGGDGTLSEVVNGVLSASGAGSEVDVRPPETAVGLIAQGTGGDFRRSLAIGRTLHECLERLASGRERHVDVGTLDYVAAPDVPKRRYFLNIVSAGMGGLVDRYVVASPSWVGGRVAYYGATLRALATVPLARLHCRIVHDGVASEREIDSRVIAVCNGAYFGSGMHVAPGAEIDDGLLEIVSIGTRTRFELVAKSPTVYRGAHLSIKAVQHFSCESIELSLPAGPAAERFPLDVDGDPLGYLPLKAGLAPRALRVRA